MAVPYTFGTATAAIPLSQLDSNFATAITIGNTAVQLGNTVTTLNNMTLANVTISSGTITITNVSVTTANVSGTANVSTLVVTANASVAGNVAVTGNVVVTGNVTSATHILTGGTANGVVYLDTTKALTTGSALVFDGTNLGVGTNSPSKSGGSRTAITINGTTLPILEFAAGNTLYGYIYSNATQATINAGGGNAAIPLTFETNSLERMRLDSSGNLGLGVTPVASVYTPSRNLFVGQASNFIGRTTINFTSLNTNVYEAPTTSAATFINASTAAAQYQQYLGAHTWRVSTNTPTANTSIVWNDAMTLNASGNLGIANTIPGSFDATGRQLVVGNGAAAQGMTIYSSAATAGSIFFAKGTTGADAYRGFVQYGQSGLTGAADAMLFGTAATERMRIDSTGIVTMNAYGVGSATFSAAGVISSVSDETWKIKDGVPVDPDSMLKKLEPGYWYYNDEKKETFGSDRQLGFYAQNVNSAIGPEAAPTPEEGKPWGYYDRSVLAVTVMSLKKALATIETLTARITALEGA